MTVSFRSALLRGCSLFFALILVLLNSSQFGAANSTNLRAKGIADGAGIWVNMWNYPADSDAFCLKLYSNGIRNIFIQTSRSNTEAICNPQGLSKLLNAAHRYQMHVIAWSFNELKNPSGDANRIISAANFKNDEGQKVDAVAANLEKDLSAAKINLFCQKIKQALGNDYPLVAVVYSPLNRAAVVSTIPWPLLADNFSVIALMSYWNSRYIATSPAYQYTLDTIKRIRELTHRPDLDIHVIGDGMGTKAESINQFLLACKNGAATSASLYPNQKITTDQLAALSHYPEFFPVDGRFRLVAFKALTKSGKLFLPAGEDPSSSIKRGCFYQLLTHQFYSNDNQMQINNSLAESNAQTDTEAFTVLSHAGIVAAAPQSAGEIAQFLAQDISSKEALETVAKIVEIKGRSKSNHLVGKSKTFVLRTTKEARQLFIQPAYAAELSQQATPLSYLDAAQIVLLASGGIN